MAATPLSSERLERIDTAQSGCSDYVIPPKGLTYVVQPICVFKRKIRRPGVLRLDEINIDFGYETSFTNKLDMSPFSHMEKELEALVIGYR